MNKEMAQLVKRRALLVGRVESQRGELAEAFAPLQVPIGYADKGLCAIKYLAQRPVLLAGVAAMAVMIKPKRWLFVLENGLLVWRVALATKRKLDN